MGANALIPSTLTCLASLLLCGCEPLIQKSTPGQWTQMPSGSDLVLTQPVQIPPGRARAYLNRGVSTASNATCTLEVRRIDHDKTQRVPAGRIPITRVQNYTELTSTTDPSAQDAVWFRLAGLSDDSGSSLVRYGYHFFLDDPRDPNLMRLTCVGWSDDPAAARPPTLDEIQAGLGAYGHIELGAAASEDGG